jgi:hypothetical protein
MAGGFIANYTTFPFREDGEGGDRVEVMRKK